MIEGHYLKESVSIFKGQEKPIHLFKAGVDKTLKRLVDKKDVSYKVGETVVLNGTGLLTYNLRQDFNVGDYMRVIYEGQDEYEDGGETTKSHQFSYEVDPEQSQAPKTESTPQHTDTSVEVSLDDLE